MFPKQGFWMGDLEPYVKRTTGLRCPTYASPSERFYGNRWWLLGYARNACISSEDVPHPASIVLVTDAADFRTGKSVSDGWSPPVVLAAPDHFEMSRPECRSQGSTCEVFGGYGSERHMKGANYGFVDGHVKWHRRDSVGYNARGGCRPDPTHLVGPKDGPTFVSVR